MQVWLPTTSKANTREAGVDVKESGFIQVQVTWKMGTLISKPILALQESCLDYIGNEKRGTKEFLVMCSFSALLLGVAILSPACVIM